MLILQRSQKGFTLIELLVVISIISLLSTIVFTAMNGARVQSRNSVRIQQIRQLQTAANIAFDTAGSFPSTSGAWTCISATCYGGWGPPAYPAIGAVDAFFLLGIPQKLADPTDPTRGYGGYVYGNPITNFLGTGAIVEYLLEPGSSCGPGKLNASTANYVQCDLKLD